MHEPKKIPLLADILLPLSLPHAYTYEVPEEFKDQLTEGSRVLVQLGKNKRYSGIVKKLHNDSKTGQELKPILEVLDISPLTGKHQLKLWNWISDYYMCSEGEVMKAAFPSALKLSSETLIHFDQTYGTDFENLGDKEYMIAEALLLQEGLKVKDVQDILGQQSVYALLHTLLEKGVIQLEEQLTERFKPKQHTWVHLAEEFHPGKRFKMLLQELETAPAQQRLVSHLHQTKGASAEKRTLLQATGVSPGALSSLLNKQLVALSSKQISRLDEGEMQTEKAHPLTEHQLQALDQLKAAFHKKDVALLHGVTSSGKTELYIKLITEALQKRQQVLYLLPEIALTAQIVTRLKRVFGNRIGIYHSRFNEQERVEIWRKVLSGEYDILLGARSAVLLPFQSLGLVIVDEEHDSSYKQADPAPRYHARDTAIYLAGLHSAKTLLGTATPSMESYYNASTGKYALVEMFKRFTDIQMPHIRIDDLAEAFRKKTMLTHFGPLMVEQIRSTLDAGRQIILFQNRRGFAPFCICEHCGHIPKCQDCDVSLTYHQTSNMLTCHYCGYQVPFLNTCPGCEGNRMKLQGFGTQKIESELGLLFPDARIKRLDQDSVRRKNSYQKLIADFEDQKIDILVGTQMVTKGLDFDHVSLVGILSADQMLNIPDYRAHERAFQLMEQVSGRAGRKKKQGNVVIQTFDPEHPVIDLVSRHDYKGFYKREAEQREVLKYPPFNRLIKLTLRHRDLHTVEQGATTLAEMMRSFMENSVLGPASPPVGRVRTFYLKDILIKLDKTQAIQAHKKAITEAFSRLKSIPEFKTMWMVADVDP